MTHTYHINTVTLTLSLAFHRSLFSYICSAFPPKSASVVAVLEKAAQHNPMFKQMDREEREMLFRAMFECKYKADDTIISEGDHGDNFYILTEGECEVFVSKTPGVPVRGRESVCVCFVWVHLRKRKVRSVV